MSKKRLIDELNEEEKECYFRVWLKKGIELSGKMFDSIRKIEKDDLYSEVRDAFFEYQDWQIKIFSMIKEAIEGGQEKIKMNDINEKAVAQEFYYKASGYSKNITKVVKIDKRILLECDWSNKYKKQLLNVTNEMRIKYPNYSFDVVENVIGGEILIERR